jgi:hypothetical protein
MAVVAQLVRALVCGAGGRGFEPHRPPQRNLSQFVEGFFVFNCLGQRAAGFWQIRFVNYRFSVIFKFFFLKKIARSWSPVALYQA